jgi:hypothetical protein
MATKTVKKKLTIYRGEYMGNNLANKPNHHYFNREGNPGTFVVVNIDCSSEEIRAATELSKKPYTGVTKRIPFYTSTIEIEVDDGPPKNGRKYCYC